MKPRRGKSYGTVATDHTWPEGTGKERLNIVLSYEQTLQFFAGLMLAVMDLQTLHRGTKEGKREAITIGYVPDPRQDHPGRLVIRQGQLERRSEKGDRQNTRG